MSRSRSLLLLLAAASAVGSTGCEIRDEQASVGVNSPWLEAAAQRITAGPDTVALAGSGRLSPESIESFQAGARRAAAERLPLLLVFRAGWCRWSGGLVEAIEGDDQLVTGSGRFVCATVDADHDAEVCRSFGVSVFPTVIVLDESGREKFRATGRYARRNLPAAFAAAVDPSLRLGSLPAAASGRSSR